MYKLLVHRVYEFDLVRVTICADTSKFDEIIRDRNCERAVSCIAFIRRSRKVLHV